MASFQAHGRSRRGGKHRDAETAGGEARGRTRGGRGKAASAASAAVPIAPAGMLFLALAVASTFVHLGGVMRQLSSPQGASGGTNCEDAVWNLSHGREAMDALRAENARLAANISAIIARRDDDDDGASKRKIGDAPDGAAAVAAAAAPTHVGNVTGSEDEVSKLRRRNKELAEELLNSYSNYYLHIPKAGGYSAFEYLRRDRLEVSSIARSGGGRRNVCNHMGVQIGQWKKWHRCWLHATESFYSSEPARRFVVLRDPTHLVLSMWGYCTESPKRRKKSKTMPPSIDIWLEEWMKVQSKRIKCPQIRQGTGTERGCPAFRCYNPLDLQTVRTGMEGRDPMDLDRQYEVVGILSELEKSTCLISIAIHRKVPQRCVCGEGVDGGQADKIRLDHGIVTHGEDMNVTEDQLLMIRNITKRDALLYEAAETIFWRKVRQVEKEFSFKMC